MAGFQPEFFGAAVKDKVIFAKALRCPSCASLSRRSSLGDPALAPAQIGGQERANQVSSGQGKSGLTKSLSAVSSIKIPPPLRLRGDGAGM